MVPRYTRPEIAAIWAPENRFRIWFEIEALAAEGMARCGAIPASAAHNIRDKGGAAVAKIGPPDLHRIAEIERETRHDVIAFLTWLADSIGPDSRFVHQGMTSSDVLDTCLSVQLAQATDLLLQDLDAVLAALKRRAFEHKLTLTIGRSHGIHAEPTTFGLKLAGTMQNLRVTRRVCRQREEKSQWRSCPGPSEHSRISIHGWRNTLQTSSGWCLRRFRPRSFRATGTQRSSAR